MKKLVKFNKEIVNAVSMYYANRALQLSGKNWEKLVDVDNVCKAAEVYGFSSEICCGSFWFCKGRNVYLINEETFPLARKTIQKVK